MRTDESFVLCESCSGSGRFQLVSLPVPFRTYLSRGLAARPTLKQGKLSLVRAEGLRREIGVATLSLEHPDEVITLNGENNAITYIHRTKNTEPC